MKNRTLLAASAAVLIFAANSPAAEKPAKKASNEAKPAAAGKKGAEAKAAPAPGKEEAKPFAVKDPVATVDGEDIKAADIEKVIESMLAQRGGSMKDVPEDMKPALYRNVIDGVIAEKLVTRESAKVAITDADVTAELERFKNQFPDEKTFNEQLAGQGQNAEGLKQNIHRYLQQNRWMEEKVKGKVDVSDAEAESFYKENPDQFKQPEEVRASHILVKVAETAADADKQAATKILERVKKGEDFGKLATELSEDPSAKSNAGDLNFFPREQMVPEFSEAAFKLKKGEISPEPVRSDFGFHIIKVTDRKDGGNVSFADAKPQLVSFLQGRKKQAEIGKVLRDLRETAKVTINLPEAPAPAPAAPAAPEGQ